MFGGGDVGGRRRSIRLRCQGRDPRWNPKPIRANKQWVDGDSALCAVLRLGAPRGKAELWLRRYADTRRPRPGAPRAERSARSSRRADGESRIGGSAGTASQCACPQLDRDRTAVVAALRFEDRILAGTVRSGAPPAAPVNFGYQPTWIAAIENFSRFAGSPACAIGSERPCPQDDVGRGGNRRCGRQSAEGRHQRDHSCQGSRHAHRQQV